MRHLVIILGDQLDLSSAAWSGFDSTMDAVWMAEVEEEATRVWCHKTRLVLFFSAMRHFRNELVARGYRVLYHELSQDPSRDRGSSFAEILRRDLGDLKPRRIIMVQAGDHRVQGAIEETAALCSVSIEVLTDTHFYCTLEDLNDFASRRRRTILEDFYRWMRRKHAILVDGRGSPAGGRWNYDAENRRSPPSDGLNNLPALPRFPPDDLTLQVMDLVHSRFHRHPGQCSEFDLPVTRADARILLDDFIRNRLHAFGPYQDCMWKGEPFLYHSRLSSSLNLKLLDPRDCVNAAVEALRQKGLPLSSVEGFVRQVLGWREYIHCLYWRHMPDYQFMNHLDHQRPLPSFYWDGETQMTCIRDCMQQLLKYGYTHHIQRLMVLGLFALLYGVKPVLFHQWHMAMYADAVDWASLPNALGMSQFADGGLVGTKPYCATGQYIERMSNYCTSCRYDPRQAVGTTACPFTTLYWDFLKRHADRLKGNRRMVFQLNNLERKKQDRDFMERIRRRADELERMFES
jgi:deoxyribodipyrimidine photolyase-related protein